MADTAVMDDVVEPDLAGVRRLQPATLLVLGHVGLDWRHEIALGDMGVERRRRALPNVTRPRSRAPEPEATNLCAGCEAPNRSCAMSVTIWTEGSDVIVATDASEVLRGGGGDDPQRTQRTQKASDRSTDRVVVARPGRAEPIPWRCEPWQNEGVVGPAWRPVRTTYVVRPSDR